jgi:hypothetical protein
MQKLNILEEIYNKHITDCGIANMSLSTRAYLKENYSSGDAESIEKIRADFKRYGIKVSYSSDEKDRRVIFSATQKQRHAEFDPFVSECNGLILRAGTWEPLVIPPCSLESHIQTDAVNAGIARGEYDIMEAVDGTLINLYFYDNEWRISTAKGFDVTYLKWNKRLYLDVFKEVLELCGVSVDSFYASLDQCTSYTFCFTHPDFHPFWKMRADNVRLVFIQSAELTTERILTINPFPNIPSQKIRVGVKNIGTLFKALPTAMDDYLKGKEPNFGYILRVKSGVENPDTLAYGHVFLESRLLQTIRNLYYNGRHTKTAREKKYDLEKYIVVNSFLDKRVNTQFLQLFPQYLAAFENLEGISVKLITKMISILECSGVKNPVGSAELKEDEPDEPPNAETLSATVLCAELKKIYTIDVKARDSARLISTFVLNPKFIGIFYELYNVHLSGQV